MSDTATSYDEVPYGHLAFAQTHPDRLATAARVFGLSPPDVTTCRILELGCASGGNLIPLAFNLPASECVGVDLSRRQVEDAHDIIRALGLGNIRVEHASILDVDRAWGEFDYIICHGVFSWVERPVQDKILQVAAENLSPRGVAYVSYNTYPGWHMREGIRHMMRYHAEPFEEPLERIEQARALLHFLASAAQPGEPYGQLLRVEIERLSHTTDAYLYHEHLEQTNAPMYFHQFIERAERAGLQYLSEADVSDMLSSIFPAPVAETLERISPDIVHLEQYMDFVRNRLFRQTLLCHKDLRPKRALTPSFMHGLLVSCRAVPETGAPELASAATVVFRSGRHHAEVTLPATKAAFAALMEEWPRAVDVDALCALALERVAPFVADAPTDDVRRATMADLFWGVMRGMIQLHTVGPVCTNRPGDPPRANALAAHQAETSNVVVNARHEMIQLDPVALEVLKLANGERTRVEILEQLLERLARGAITLERAGEAVTAPDVAREILSGQLEATLASLARSAVLAG